MLGPQTSVQPSWLILLLQLWSPGSQVEVRDGIATVPSGLFDSHVLGMEVVGHMSCLGLQTQRRNQGPASMTVLTDLTEWGVSYEHGQKVTDSVQGMGASLEMRIPVHADAASLPVQTVHEGQE